MNVPSVPKLNVPGVSKSETAKPAPKLPKRTYKGSVSEMDKPLAIVRGKISDEEEVWICGYSLPKSVVRDFSDFSIGKKLGEGKFGSVHQGYLDIGMAR